MKKYHIISNLTAGKTKSVKNLEKTEKVFSERGVSYETHFTKSVGDATEITRELTLAGEKEIIALGGDGTLHEVLNGLADPTACRLGLIPSGTGNDFAQKAGLSLDAEETAKFILENEPKDTDYIEISGRRCMNVSGLGIDVEVLERCQRGKLKGKIKYFISLIQTIFKYKGTKITVEADGNKEEYDALLANACNGSVFGGGIKICPTAEIDDGKLDAIVVENLGGKFKIISALIQLMKGKILEHPKAKHILCESLSLSTPTPCTIQMDGELYKGVPFIAKIKRGLKFYR